mmetsp:Transcript_52706/g.140586  ORF Transcript_52706/g.140586 Transcript_52706/m.140586 type:complete len:250 (+) Transcript_52706:465-1214(+)
MRCCPDLLISRHSCASSRARRRVLMWKLVALQSVEEKDGDRIHEEFRSRRIVVTFHHHEVFVPSVRLVQLLRMVRSDEGIVVRSREESWDERVLDVVDGCEVEDVESSVLLDGTAHHLQGEADDEFRNLEIDIHIHELLTENLKIRERAVKNDSCDRGITIQVKQCCGRSHGAPPQAYASHPVCLPQVIDNHSQVVPLIVTQREVLSTRQARSREVEAKDCDVEREQHWQSAHRLQPAAAVTMKVHDAW